MQRKIHSGFIHLPTKAIQSKTTTSGTRNGYTPNGLPFQLAFKFPTTENDKFDTLFRNTILPLLRNTPIKINKDLANRAGYPRMLSYRPDPSTICINNMIDEIQKAVKELQLSDLSLSLGFTYQVDDKLYCAGFACGETGLAIDYHNEVHTTSRITLVKPGEEQTFTDHFSHTLSDELFADMKAMRCQQFSREVKHADRLFAFVDAPAELLDNYSCEVINNNVANLRVITTPITLKSRNENESLSDLFNRLSVAKQKRSINSEISIPSAEEASQNSQSILANAEQEVTQLAATLPDDDARKQIVKNIIDQAKQLANEPNEITNIINTYASSTSVLTNNTPENIERLRQQAIEMDRASSKVSKAISIGLLALAAISMTVGLALIISGFGFVPGLTLLMVTAPLLQIGILHSAIDIGFHKNYTSRLFGLTKQLSHLAEEQVKIAPAPGV